ncbi:hypothetical protein TrVFT333_005665 [Trichoderma virens FT-333]|nr:hypothetical protein TrVFT333_005665 [Trichoderma virens FT-333]
MASEAVNGNITADTITVKWDVKGGADRTEHPEIGESRVLAGTPNIQGITITSDVDVTVHCWADASASGEPTESIDGPTNGKEKLNPTRIGSYRVDFR